MVIAKELKISVVAYLAWHGLISGLTAIILLQTPAFADCYNNTWDDRGNRSYYSCFGYCVDSSTPDSICQYDSCRAFDPYGYPVCVGNVTQCTTPNYCGVYDACQVCYYF